MGINQEEGPIGHTPWRDMNTRPAIGPEANLKETPRAMAINNMGTTVGGELLSRYLVAFEVAGVLLTAALVGAIALAMSDGTSDDDPSARVHEREATALAKSDAEHETTLTGAGA
jgi:NADH-quinone oxidoreductase subunit J